MSDNIGSIKEQPTVGAVYDRVTELTKVHHAYSPPREEGWTRHLENAAKPPLWSGRGGCSGTMFSECILEAWVTEQPPRLRVLRWLRSFFLNAQPPLLTRRGLRLIHAAWQFIHIFHDRALVERAYSRTGKG